MGKRSTYRNSFYDYHSMFYHKVGNISNKDYIGNLNSKNISKIKVELGIFVFYSDAFPDWANLEFLVRMRVNG